MKKYLILGLLFITTLFSGVASFALDTQINGPEKIYKQFDKILTTNTIKNLYSFNDEPIEIIKDTYTGFGDVSSTYELIFQSGSVTKNVQINVMNLIHHKVIAVVIEDGIPIIWVNKDKELIVNQQTNEIVTTLQRIGFVTVTSLTQPQVLINDYTINYDTPNLYTFEFKLLSADGSEQYVLAKVKVTNSDTLEDSALIKPDSFNLMPIVLYVLGGIVLAIIVVKGFQILKKSKKGRY